MRSRRLLVMVTVLTTLAVMVGGCTRPDAPISPPAAPVTAPLQIQTSSGELQGVRSGSTRQFLGVR